MGSEIVIKFAFLDCQVRFGGPLYDFCSVYHLESCESPDKFLSFFFLSLDF